jgi:hypothetical protein
MVASYRCHLAEEDTDRLRAMQELAIVYTILRTSEKVKKAVSLLEEVIKDGRETLHADPEEWEQTQELLADAQEELRQISHEQLFVDFEEEQGILDETVERTSGNAICRRLRRPMRRAVRIF